MIYYNRSDKTLIIPDGIGNGSVMSYESGFTAGREAQKAIDEGKLTPSATFITNGEYTAPYGYQKVKVEVEGGDCSEAVAEAYESGYTAGEAEGFQEGYESGVEAAGEEAYASGITAGEAAQKAKLTAITITENGHYQREDGYNDINVQITSGDCSAAIAEAYASGQTVQKGKLIASSFTANGIYTRADGWSSVTVNVSGGGGGNAQLEKDYSVPSGITNYVTVYPDDGYDSMRRIRIDCADINHYNREWGMEYARSQMDGVVITHNGTYTYGTQGNYFYGVSSVTVSVDTSSGYNFTQFVQGTFVLNSSFTFTNAGPYGEGALFIGSDARIEATVAGELQDDLITNGTTLPAGEYGFIFCLNYKAGDPMPWMEFNEDADGYIKTITIADGV